MTFTATKNLNNQMILYCSSCSSNVSAITLHSYSYFEEIDHLDTLWTFSKCPKCSQPFLTVQNDFGEGFQEDSPYRAYPPEKRKLGFMVPMPIKDTYKEAVDCFNTKAYTASAIMCRKALEGLCASFNAKNRNLANNLKKLRDDGTIDERLFEWAETLRALGNEAAHGVEKKISAQDASDVLEFTEALTEYIFTFRKKFEQFKKRREYEKLIAIETSSPDFKSDF